VSIYVSIASYEDPFLERTVKSAIDNALYPENLYFGIAVQNEKIKIPDFSFIKTENLSLLNLNAKNRPGVVRIRYILRKLMRNQDYFLQIDSHMFFEKNWDINLIKKFNELKQITGKDKVIISKFLTRHIGKENEEEKNSVTSFYINNNSGYNFLGIGSEQREISKFKNIEIIGDFAKTQYITGQFIFSDNTFITDGSFDSYSDFFTEEYVDSIFSYIRGYDTYAILGYNYLSHNNEEYNELVYGSKNFSDKTFKVLSEKDKDHIVFKPDFYKFLFNSKNTRFYIHDVERTFEDFCIELGLDFYFIKNNYYEYLKDNNIKE